MTPKPIRPVSRDEIVAALTLARARGVGPAHFSALVEHFGSAQAVVSNNAAQLHDEGVPPKLAKAICSVPYGAARRDLDWCDKHDSQVIVRGFDGYPTRLIHIPDPPPILFVRGDYAACEPLLVAIVGARRPTPAGVEIARRLGESFAHAGLAVVSGLALGIDAAAHRGALEGGGLTVAVGGCGLGQVYPRGHSSLSREVAAHGALMTEFPPDTAPHPAHFPRRNRIVSGISAGVVVVEATRKSGSLITARLAGDQGRSVFAVPGSPMNRLSDGTNWLLRQGASLVRTADDVIRELAPQLRSTVQAQPAPDVSAGLGGVELTVYRALMAAPADVDSVVANTGCSVAAIRATLVKLELTGKVRAMSDGCWGVVA
jgi:DNA processing protein